MASVYVVQILDSSGSAERRPYQDRIVGAKLVGRDSVEPSSCGRLSHRWFWFFLSFLPFWVSEFYFGRIPGICVIVAYRPKPGKEDEVLALVRSRVPNLRIHRQRFRR